MSWKTRHLHNIHRYVKEVNDNAWIVYDNAMISRHTSKPSQPHWEDGEGGFFTMDEAPSPKPPTRPLSDSCPFTDILKESYSGLGLYKVGNAHLHIVRNVGAQEHNTLKAVAERNYNFMVPTEYCHGVYGDGHLYYIAYSILPGKSIAEMWPKTKDDALKTKWTRQIADAYYELSKWRGDRICGIDGGNLNEQFIINGNWWDTSLSTPEALLKNFKDINMDCSEIVFAHNKMMPLAFMVDGDQGLVGISTWYSAGFVPKGWIQTLPLGNSFTESAGAIRDTWTDFECMDWSRKIDDGFEERGLNGHRWESWADWQAKRVFTERK
ncbi:hypothetical protein SNK03_006883 [Fusarium graminearum]|uniref:Chromosome 2, complete genome n=2 Tax=Gibberella zeae (strain ATCC MYA-4620 / CBS 123657 / FGSC 9075 / NRRL 31084 / PH-1) TaxID=229533 RepID=A0A0E0S691_GIBZE|nr:hypothetical protein FG05_04079 [Fusarium graminearum]CAF3510690.1 unnamed protein product [Fusarium graminearum]CAF3655140.1 unnamed protein product [Fusarium graminearum]CEF79016.1 unnamed protein product [Fusarium graminearum]